MTPNSKLDRLVAEKVMGKTVVAHINASTLHLHYIDLESCLIPAYSEDIREAWKVVEKLRDLFPGHRFNLLMTNDEAQGPGLKYGFSIVGHLGMGSFDVVADCVADTPARAICEAALKALEAQKV
jgi:hypothetical protein